MKKLLVAIIALSPVVSHAAQLSSYPLKTTPHANDTFIISDSEASNATKRVTMTSVISALDTTDFTASEMGWTSQSNLETWLGWSFSSSTETLTNKTYDVLGTGNSFTDVYELPVTILAPADTDDPLIDKVKRATTLTGIDCVALGGGTISVDLQECDANGDNCATTGATIASCGATNTNDASLTDTSIASGAWLKLVIGAPSGTVNQVSVKVYGTQVK